MMKAHRGYTHEPCHGCGSVTERLKTSVCVTCRSILSEHRMRIEESKQNDSTTIILVSCERDYAMPYMNHEESGIGGTKPISHKLWELSRMVSVRTSERAAMNDKNHSRTLWTFAPGRYQEWRENREFQVGTATALNELQQLIDAGLTAAYRDGVDDGKNLLMGLASGRITNEAFNNKAANLTGSGS